jgi:hypothetical protein
MEVAAFQGGDGMSSSGEGRAIFDDQCLDRMQVTTLEEARGERAMFDGWYLGHTEQVTLQEATGEGSPQGVEVEEVSFG